MKARTVIVFGATSELGMSAVRSLARQDPVLSFLLHYRSSNQEFESLCNDLGSRAERVEGDLAVESSVRSLRDRVLAICAEPAAVLFAAAPALQLRRFKEIPAESIRNHLEVQVIGPAVILQGLLPRMARAASPSRVVFVLSEVVRKTPKGMADYTLAKFATLGLMRSLQAEFGGSGKIGFHAIAPGMMETKFLRDLPELAVAAAKEQAQDGRLVSVGDVGAELARLLLGSETQFGNSLYLEGNDAI